jgi:DNA-binding NtrC family response regulator
LLGLLGLVRGADATPHAPDSEAQRLRASLQEVRERLQARVGFDTLIGKGASHRRLLAQVDAAAATTVPILIVGEPGTGKRLVARTIHQRGPRPSAPLVPFDAAALPPEVLERELFESNGVPLPRFGLPDGATILLGDLLDLPRDLQARLAEAIEHGRVRLIATTRADPDQALHDDRLRPDFYYALTGLVIRLDPLSDRLAELPLLAQHFLERANLRGDRRRAGIDREALAALLAYDWPGNLRELARVLDAAHGQGVGDLVALADLPAAIRGHLASAYNPPAMPPPVTPLDDLLNQLERRLIEQALQRARQNKSRAADLLEISRPRLYRRIRDLGIPDGPEPTDEPPPPPTEA